jgi:hypothetical protein
MSLSHSASPLIHCSTTIVMPFLSSAIVAESVEIILRCHSAAFGEYMK